MPSYTFFFAVETNLSFWWDWEKFSQKSVPSHMFLRCRDYPKFLRGLGKFRQKDVPSYTFFSLWRLTWVFEGTWKNFHKKVCPVICFFAVETILSVWWDLESFDKKMWPVTHFFHREDYLKFWMGLRKVSTTMCAQLNVFFSLWRLTWVFEGTWKNFHKKKCPVICFFAVETVLDGT